MYRVKKWITQREQSVRANAIQGLHIRTANSSEKPKSTMFFTQTNAPQLFFFYNMQWYHNEVFRLPYGCTVSFSEGNKTWDKDIERRKKNRSLPACPNATVCLRNSVCSEHSDTIHIVLLSKDTVLRIIRLKNIQSFWELSGFKVLHTVSGLAEGKVMHLSLKLKSSSSLSTRPAISCCSL